MTNHRLPVLIFAQSARLLAQSATHAGYTVWVADCFLDVDTPADRKCKLPDLAPANISELQKILTELTTGEPCNLIYGSGIEYCSELLTALPANIRLIGNNLASLNHCNNPQLFFYLLKKLQISHPKTVFNHSVDTHENWLVKQTISLGGQAIKAHKNNDHGGDCYLQQYITGVSASALFLSTDNKIEILSINKQHQSHDSFLLAGIETPLTISQANLSLLKSIIYKLSRAIELQGLNSIDFIIDQQDKLFVLEVNPRPSASMALMRSDELNLIEAHIKACQNNMLSTINKTPSYRGFYYLYSNKNLTIPADIKWPDYCSDMPTPGTVIENEQPICSFFVETNTAENCQRLRKQYEKQITNLFG